MFETGDAIRGYLLETFLPYWRDRGIDGGSGSFYDALTPEGRPVIRDSRRLLVQCRQIYVFSHGRLLGAGDWSLEAAQRGFEYLKRALWDPDHGGWLRAVTGGGRILDDRKDTYDHAFVLFAMAYLHRASGSPEPLRAAERTLELLEDRLADPVQGGFMEGAERDWTLIAEPRRQNPHMHLFEAFLALHEASGDERYLLHAHRIYGLFTRHFFDRVHGCLGEYFGRDWERHGSELGAVTEPGHHFEWVWLLHQYARIADSDEALDLADKLYRFASRRGLDPRHGGAYDQVDREGKVLQDGKRVWPQTEHLKACAARMQAGDPQAGRRLREGLDLCGARHVVAGTGGWRDHLSRDWDRVTSAEMPATTAYHVFLGLSEAARVLGNSGNP